MTNYTFETLNDKEFEKLVKDLLNAKFKYGLQDFKIGPDKGIDLRVSGLTKNNEIVVQVKHYSGSTYSQLKHILKTKELSKAQKLQPDRYIVATSLSLLAHQKDELKDILSPYVLSSNDIISREDLNGYLLEFEEIEKKYFKLWFSSTAVFNEILNNAVEGRAKYLLEKLSKKIPFYVITNKVEKAIEILKKEKILLITGQPGIGKTTLAEILLFDRARNDYKIYQVVDILEAENVLSSNYDEKQLFFIDDFLGSNYNELLNSHKSETALTNFIERVVNTANKYIILTTRTVILSQASMKFEKISRFKSTVDQFELKLSDYSQYEKALILYNHLYFKHLPDDKFNSILIDGFYWKIIGHKNYTPRIIDFITEIKIIAKIPSSDYQKFIMDNLNNPSEIWRYSFENQIDFLDQCFLITLFSMSGRSFESALMKAYENRLAYEKSKFNPIITSNQFSKSIKKLLEGFIIINLYNSTPPNREYTFINPSLTDFLIGFVANSFEERKNIISSIYFVEQLSRFKAINKIPLEPELQLIIKDRISNLEILDSYYNEKYNNNNNNNYKNSVLLYFLTQYCPDVNTDELVLSYLSQLDFNSSWHNIIDEIVYSLLNIKISEKIKLYLENHFIKIIEKLIVTIDDIDQAKLIPHVFSNFGFDYEDYISGDGFEMILSMIGKVLKNNELGKNNVKVVDIETVENDYEQLYDLEEELKSMLFLGMDVDYDFDIGLDYQYWNYKIEENIEKQSKFEASDEDYDYQIERFKNEANERKKIEDLFTII